MPSDRCQIHPSAVVSPLADIAEGVSIGPGAVIEAGVRIGPDTSVGPYTVIHANTRLGARNRIHAHVVLGDAPQHTAYKEGSQTGLEIGDDNELREMVTVHRALHVGETTRLGSGCLLMVNAHLGHDCQVGDHVVVTNNTALGGHVEVGDRAIIGGQCGVHQFVRIGAYTMIAALTMVRKDVLPYTMLAGDPACHYRLNTVGLRRNGVTGERYGALERAFRMLRAGGEVGTEDTPELQFLRRWLAEPSRRGLSGFRRAGRFNKKD